MSINEHFQIFFLCPYNDVILIAILNWQASFCAQKKQNLPISKKKKNVIKVEKNTTEHPP